MTPQEIEASRQSYYKTAALQTGEQSVGTKTAATQKAKKTYSRKQLKTASKKKGAKYAGRILSKIADTNPQLATAIHTALSDQNNPAVSIKTAARIKKHLAKNEIIGKIKTAATVEPTKAISGLNPSEII